MRSDHGLAVAKEKKDASTMDFCLPLFTFKGDEVPNRSLSDELSVYIWDRPISSFDYRPISLQVDGVHRKGSLHRRVHCDRILPVRSELGHGEGCSRGIVNG